MGLCPKWDDMGMGQNLVPHVCSHQNSWDLWMLIPLKMVLIGILIHDQTSTKNPKSEEESSPRSRKQGLIF